MPVWPTWSVCGSPAGARDDARAADGGVERLRELLEDLEPLGGADAAAAADDDLGLGERDAASGRRPRARRPGRRGRPARGPGANGSTAGAPAPWRPRGGDRVRGDRQQAASRHARLLEQAAAPAHARDVERPSPRRRRPRCSSPRTAGRAARRRAPAPRCRGSCPRRRRRSGCARPRRSRSAPSPPARTPQPLVLGDVGGRHAVRAELGGGVAGARADEQRLERLAAGERSRASVSACSESSSTCPAACSTSTSTITPPPARASRPTTAGAASGPWPRISACLPWPGGTTSRSVSRRGRGRSGVRCSTGFGARAASPAPTGSAAG